MRLRTILGASSSALVLALSGCSSATGGDSLKSVEDKAVKLATDSVNAVAPHPGDSVLEREWSKCSEETPGVHRATYLYVLRLAVDKSASQPVFDQLAAYWQKQGYEPEKSGDATPSFFLPDDSDWHIGAGIDNDGQAFLTVDAECVHVSSDPKVG